jgi:hypothetical protein
MAIDVASWLKQLGLAQYALKILRMRTLHSTRLIGLAPARLWDLT